MKYSLIFLTIIIISCIDQPAKSPIIDNEDDISVVILCEGLMGMENSSISIINSKRDFFNNYYKSNNINYLGDTANDIYVKNDTAIVCLTGSGAIEIFQISTGKSIKRIVGNDIYPRQIVENKGNYFITDLYQDKVYKMNSNFELTDFIKNGLKNPEGILCVEDYLYVANSGLGIFNQSNEYAGTISIFNLNNGEKIKDVYVGANVQEITYSSVLRLFAVSYYNTYEKDSIGGIKLYNDNLLSNISYYIKINNTSINFDDHEKRLYFIAQTPPGNIGSFNSSISYIDLIDMKIKELVANNQNNNFWYSMAIDKDKNIWIGNAKNLQINGEILMYNSKLELLKTYSSGVNPNKIVHLK